MEASDGRRATKTLTAWRRTGQTCSAPGGPPHRRLASVPRGHRLVCLSSRVTLAGHVAAECSEDLVQRVRGMDAQGHVDLERVRQVIGAVVEQGEQLADLVEDVGALPETRETLGALELGAFPSPQEKVRHR